MAHEVFVSHSSLDKPIADAVCAALEVVAVRCWIAPRDVQPGRSFAGEITRAIQRSRVMVLIFSAHSNVSEQILREVQLAANAHLHIVQFRIQDVVPNEDLEYYLSAPHWLDAMTPPLENHIQQLVTSVKALLQLAQQGATAPLLPSQVTQCPPQPAIATITSVPAQPAGQTPSKTKRAIWIAAAVAIFFLGASVVYFYMPRRGATRQGRSQAVATAPLPGQQASPANLPPPADILFSDSFRRADAGQWDIGQGDMAFGGRARFFYLPIFGGTRPVGAVIRANALENGGLDFGGIQFAASLAERGANLGQDMNMRVDLFVPTDAARNITQAGPYFRSRAAAAGDGIFGGTSSGYWVALYSTGEVKVEVLNGRPGDPIVAASGTPSDFDPRRMHTIEVAVSGGNLEVALDGYLLGFDQNGQTVTTVDIPPFWNGPPVIGVNDGTAGLCFGAKTNRGKIGGQRATNLVVTTFRSLSGLPVKNQRTGSSGTSRSTSTRFVPQLGLSPEASLQQAGLKVRSATGALAVAAATANMVLGHGRTAVLIVEGGPVTNLELELDRPARKIFLERIGTSHGSSVPTWRIESLDKSGQVLDSFGEEHGLPAEPRTVELSGQGIAAIRLSTDNRFGSGTWATWNCLPVSELSWEQ
jgi:TIR domain